LDVREKELSCRKHLLRLASQRSRPRIRGSEPHIRGSEPRIWGSAPQLSTARPAVLSGRFDWAPNDMCATPSRRSIRERRKDYLPSWAIVSSEGLKVGHWQDIGPILVHLWPGFGPDEEDLRSNCSLEDWSSLKVLDRAFGR
jgi:hypothetical protein